MKNTTLQNDGFPLLKMERKQGQLTVFIDPWRFAILKRINGQYYLKFGGPQIDLLNFERVSELLTRLRLNLPIEDVAEVVTNAPYDYGTAAI